MRTAGRAKKGRAKSPPARRPRGRLGASTLAILAALALMATPSGSLAGEGAPAQSLTIAILDLSEIPVLAPPPPPAEPRRPAWRTTFGSERETQPEIDAGAVSGPLAALADIDAVLIQGVQAAAPLRRLFPPRDWRLIVSRRVLSATEPVGFRTVRRDLAPTTAIAVKASENLRVTARTLTLDLDAPPADQTADREQAAATAVRLVDRRGRTLWLASITLPPSCIAEDPPCPALASLDAWRKEKRDGGEPTLIGGQTNARAPASAGPKAAGAPVACASHSIESDIAWERITAASAELNRETSDGCISVLRLID